MQRLCERLIDKPIIHPVRIDRRQHRGSVELGDLGGGEPYVNRAQIVFELREFRRAENYAAYGVFREQPRDCHLRYTCVVRHGKFAHAFDQREALFFVERQNVEARITVVGIGKILAPRAESNTFGRE